MPEQSQGRSTERAFKKAEPAGPVIEVAREIVRIQLALGNKLHVSDGDLDHLRGLPHGAGVVLICNHADEMDPRICLELSRRCGRRFISMCNREAFDELSGLAGWALQRLGHFSVERGSHDSRAKQYAIDVVKESRDILLIFPEGEIFYLNEEIQPFHSGAVEICMQAILQRKMEQQDWKVFMVPMAVKYHYRAGIERALETRISRMELRLSLPPAEQSLASRLRRIQKALLEREELAHEVRADLERDLFERIVTAEGAILTSVEERRDESANPNRNVLDEAWRVGAGIRADLEGETDEGKRRELKNELEDLEEVAHLASWRPGYYDGDVSFDRLAEVVLKLERELYQQKRPRQLTRRDVFLSIGEPIELSNLVSDYEDNAHAFRHEFTKRLHDTVQGMVDDLVDNYCLKKVTSIE